MSVQFPTLSQPTQTARYTEISNRTLYPYSYPFYINNLAASLFTKTDPVLGLGYFSIGFQADNNLAITAFEFQASINTNTSLVSPNNALFYFEASYSPIPDANLLNPATPPAIPTTPADSGNIIYRNFLQFLIPKTASPGLATPVSIDDFRRYEPYNYLVKFNQIIYFHFAADMTTLTIGGNIGGIIIFHTLPTGLKI